MSDAVVFCSKCGAAGQRVESYCRSCGEWLPDPSAAWHPRGRLRQLSPERKQRRMRLLELLSAIAAAVSGVIALSVLTGADIELLVIPVVLCFAVIGWQAVAFFLGRSIQGRRSQGSDEGGQALPAAQEEARRSLNAADTRDLIRPPSVTEHTTELLEPGRARRGDA